LQEITFKQIEYGSETYKEELQFRNRVLRIPLGMSLFDENLEKEATEIHLGAFSEYRLIGVLILSELNKTEVKMRQVAIDDGWRNKGIGSQFIKFSENFCAQKFYTTILLHARKTAVHFYEKCGYQVQGDAFLEINIPHFKMYKSIKQQTK